MQKSSNKKLITANIAFFALVVLLAITVTITGAWYTAKSGNLNVDTGGLDMGTVTLSADSLTPTVKSQTLNNIKLLPTMQIDISEITYTGTVNAYYRLEVTSSNEKNSAGQNFTGDELTTLQNILGQATVYNAVTPNSTIQAQSITIPSTLNNTYQGASATLTITLTVIQQPNLADALTPEAAQNAFEQFMAQQ